MVKEQYSHSQLEMEGSTMTPVLLMATQTASILSLWGQQIRMVDRLTMTRIAVERWW